MLNRIWPIGLVVFAAAAWSAGTLEEELAETENAGKRLFQLTEHQQNFKPNRLQNWRDLRRSLRPMFCPGMRYKYYRLDNWIYALASVKSDFVMGRHIEFRVFGNEADLNSVRQLSRECRRLPDSRDNKESQTLEYNRPFPGAIHVWLNLDHHFPLKVVTPAGVWRVADGLIEPISQVAPQPSNLIKTPIPLPF